MTTQICLINWNDLRNKIQKIKVCCRIEMRAWIEIDKIQFEIQLDVSRERPLSGISEGPTLQRRIVFYRLNSESLLSYLAIQIGFIKKVDLFKLNYWRCIVLIWPLWIHDLQEHKPATRSRTRGNFFSLFFFYAHKTFVFWRIINSKHSELSD